MKREARLLKEKGVDSLVLTIEHFNRPSERGRITTVLILLDHAFEMLLKSAILHRGGKIREARARETIGFDACVRKALDGTVQFLSKEQALAVQVINGLRDAAQHHLLELPEQQLYLHTQVGVTLFRDLLKKVFNDNLACHLPDRVLPVSTQPPKDLALMVEDEVKVIRDLLRPGKRRRVEARAHIRSLAILEATTRGERTQPSVPELNALLRGVAEGDDWDAVFPGIASLALSVEGEGIPFAIRIVKKEQGIPIHIVPEGTPGASVVAVKRVDELGFYSLGHVDLAEKCGLTTSQTTALVRHLKLQEDADFFKEFRIGRSVHKRYSPKAVDRIRSEAPKLDVPQITRKYWTTARKRK